MRTKQTIDEIKKKLKDFVPVMDGLSRSRNPFELRYFVIGKHDDRIQQYKQAVIEMDAKYQAVEEGLHAIKLLELDRNDLMSSDLTARDALEIQKIDREIRRVRIGVTGAFKEVLDFITIIENEYSDLVEKTEEEILEYETEYWKSRLAKQVHIDIITQGRIGAGNLSTIESMPKQLQEEVLLLAGKRTEEFKQFDKEITQKIQLHISESYPHKTQFIAPPVYVPLKLRKDAPEDYPEDRIVNNDITEIMIATLHRPDDKKWLSENFYIPAGKNYVKHWVTCDDPQMVGEWRNRIILDALSLNCTHVFFVDDDLVVDSGALQKLYAHNLDIVGGWFVKKTPVVESATMVKDGLSKKPVPLDATGLVEIDWSLAAGLTLIKTDVFRKVAYPWYLTTSKSTEDTYMTQRAIENGFRVYLDTDVKAIHVDKKTGKEYGFN